MPELNQIWAARLVGTAVACGVREAVICPGSRSTPLALAFAARQDVTCFSIVDERSAAFFALGKAKKTDRPVALVCTSGSAGAHFLPALMEASVTHVPLLVLTADRPWELHGFGAPQTVDQSNLYGGFVRGQLLLPAPEGAEPMLMHLQASLTALMRKALNAPRGPVHVNVAFRDPLAPADGSELVTTVAPQNVVNGRSIIDVTGVAETIRSARRGVVVCGPRFRNDQLGQRLGELAEAIGFALLAEAGSGARFGSRSAVPGVDLILKDIDIAQKFAPDVVLRFGGGLSSKTLQGWVDASGAHIVQFSEDGDQVDAAHAVSQLLIGDVTTAVEALMNVRSVSSENTERWLQAGQRVRALCESSMAPLDEPSVAREVVAALPGNGNLMLSSSMPIRDVDVFADRPSSPLQVFCNRGLNGIDGIVSAAMGVAAGAREPTVALVGDVALLHDLNALIFARRLQLNLTVVVVNNDGGGIFHFLPVADRTSHFETLFGTPHGVEFEHLAALAGATFHQPKTLTALRASLASALEGGLHLIEVKTDRPANVLRHRELAAEVAASLRGVQ